MGRRYELPDAEWEAGDQIVLDRDLTPANVIHALEWETADHRPVGSSSVAKDALAALRISFARRSSVTSLRSRQFLLGHLAGRPVVTLVGLCCRIQFLSAS
ncbi:hypothetical protein [Micromonospora chersina]|uniref:hypothetical protein n=1 Tax=Micromonospora chersina TaxID=47854 RepID=UPI0036A603A5